MKTAIYLCGHGALREPRIIELQYLRILRYLNALEEKIEKLINVEEVFVDVNFPRSSYTEGLYNLKRLTLEIKEKKIEAVILDICLESGYQTYRYDSIIWELEKAGAKVYNCYYDDEEALLAKLRNGYGSKVQGYHLPTDSEEFFTLFPTLSSRIISDAIEDYKKDKEEASIDHVYRRIQFLREAKPYSGGSYPWITHSRFLMLMKLRESDFAERRLTEDVYILSPSGTGSLIDEGISNPRNSKSMEWSIERVIGLGFKHEIEENRNAFVMEYARDIIVYADPREEGNIAISVYKIEREEESNNAQKSIREMGKFKILDGWKNELYDKFKIRIDSLLL